MGAIAQMHAVVGNWRKRPCASSALAQWPASAPVHRGSRVHMPEVQVDLCGEYLPDRSHT